MPWRYFATATTLQLQHEKENNRLYDMNPKLERRISFVRASVRPSRSGDPPWNLKRAGLESSGWRLVSSIGKTKKITFCFFFQRKKKIQKKINKKNDFLRFFEIFGFFDHFWKFLDFLVFYGFFNFFCNFLGFFWIFSVFWDSFQSY